MMLKTQGVIRHHKSCWAMDANYNGSKIWKIISVLEEVISESNRKAAFAHFSGLAQDTGYRFSSALTFCVLSVSVHWSLFCTLTRGSLAHVTASTTLWHPEHTEVPPDPQAYPKTAVLTYQTPRFPGTANIFWFLPCLKIHLLACLLFRLKLLNDTDSSVFSNSLLFFKYSFIYLIGDRCGAGGRWLEGREREGERDLLSIWFIPQMPETDEPRQSQKLGSQSRSPTWIEGLNRQ